MEVRAPGTPLTAPNVQPRAHVTHVGLSGVTAAPKLNGQDDLSLGSNTWICAAIILGAAVAIRTLGRRGSLVKGLKRNPRSSKRIYMGVKGGMRNPYWYGGEESPRAPSWLPGYTPEEKDGETLPKPDEGSEPPASLPKFVNLEWWQSQPAAIKTRSPSYWRRLFNDTGERRFERFKPYSLPEAIDIIFAGYEGDWHDKDDTFELKLKMALDSKYPDQQIRTKVELPHGLGKEQRVAVFCAPEEEKEMLDMGASIAGKTLQDQIQAEEFEFDVLITKPASMPALAKLGKILGKRRLMPSPKSGTVVTDIEGAIKEWKKGGTLELRSGARMVISVPFGKQSQGKEKLLENVRSLLQQLADKAPEGAKKQKDFFSKMHIQSHGGPSIVIDSAEWPSHGYVAPKQEDSNIPLALRMA
eukprot:s782_g15.t1